MIANFTTGPVAMRPEVRAALLAAPVPHRDASFLQLMSRTRASLKTLVNAPNVVLMIGSGTLANDVVAAQIKGIGGPGLVLSNGEFGERLLDHARRWDLEFSCELAEWGNAFNWNHLRQVVSRSRPAWIWAVLTETSTGVLNPLTELLTLSRSVNAGLCLDAVSAVGLMPVDLAGVRLASAVSGKGLAAFPGLAAVFHDGRLAVNAKIPRYLDLSNYESADSVPFTHSSNLVAALDRALTLPLWPRKFHDVRRKSRALRESLRLLGLPPLAHEEHAAPGIVTLALPADVSSAEVGAALADQGIQVAWQSRYLQHRNWLQICLMGEVNERVLSRLADLLVRQVSAAQLSELSCLA